MNLSNSVGTGGKMKIGQYVQGSAFLPFVGHVGTVGTENSVPEKFRNNYGNP
jgi:hypothetical protein